MPFTANGNRKLAARLKTERGLTSDGKSLHHQKAGQAVTHRSPGYFAKLAETPEGRLELAKIARKGADASNKKQGKTVTPQTDQTSRPSELGMGEV